MRYLLTALAVFMIAPPAFAEDIEPRDLAYARCLMRSYEHGIREGQAHEIYIIACMRVAGYEPEQGKLTGGARYNEASGG
jgi:hypothetical protein